ncbi:hypothetical protein IF2G_10833 [Cordyceps javanica]|nr:hypothetical protein IF2G_10833 [Cordyceps javanica]
MAKTIVRENAEGNLGYKIWKALIALWKALIALWKALIAPREIGGKGETAPASRRNCQHDELILDCYDVPWKYPLQASIASWMLLAGYLVLPSAFNSMKKSSIKMVGQAADLLEKNVPLLWLAGCLCGISTLWISWLCVRMRKNYVWLGKNIFLLQTNPVEFKLGIHVDASEYLPSTSWQLPHELDNNLKHHWKHCFCVRNVLHLLLLNQTRNRRRSGYFLASRTGLHPLGVVILSAVFMQFQPLLR